MEFIASREIPEDHNELFLKIEAKGNVYSFPYAFDPDKWNLLKENVDAAFLSTRIAGGFVGCMYALYATSLNKPSKNAAYFNWFDYQGNDEVYK